METSIQFTIHVADDFSYRALKAIYNVLPYDGSRLWSNEERKIEGYTNGGVYDLIQDVRSIRYILSKYNISDVNFSIYAKEDRDCGYMGMFHISYENNDATMAEISYAVFNDEEDYEDCSNLTFAITGMLIYFDTREEFTEYITEERGGRVVDSISSKIDYLITNNSQSDTSKNRKAKELGIPVITEKEFLFRFGNPDDIDELREEIEQENEANAREYLEISVEKSISDDLFWTAIWKIEPFSSFDIDSLDEKLQQSFADIGFCL